MLRNWNIIKTVFVHLWLDKQVAKYFKMFYHQITIVLGNTVYVFKKYFSFFLLFRRPFYSKIYDTKDITILWILLYHIITNLFYFWSVCLWCYVTKKWPYIASTLVTRSLILLFPFQSYIWHTLGPSVCFVLFLFYNALTLWCCW